LPNRFVDSHFFGNEAIFPLISTLIQLTYSAFIGALPDVISSSRKPVSAKQNLSLPLTRGLAVLCILPGILLLLFVSPSRADSLDDAVHKLALKVCLAPHSPSARVQWQESPEASGYFSESRKKVFVDQISACGISPAENPEVPAMKIAISVTTTQALLTSDSLDSAGTRQIHMVEMARSSLFSPKENASAPHLASELLWEQEKPIYSATEWLEPALPQKFFLLFTGAHVLRYGSDNGSWKMLDATELPASGRRLRRGEGTFSYGSNEKLRLMFSARVCEFIADEHFSMKCADRSPGSLSPAVSLSSNCEPFRRMLVTGDGDYTQLDRITLTRPLDAGLAPPVNEKYSTSVDMPGPVLDINTVDDNRAAFAVVLNLSTGNYEVYRITSVCGN